MVGILISSGAAWADESAEPRKSLRIANWSMYIDFDDNMPEDLPPEKRSPTLREFAEKFNCDIEYHEFDTFDSMLAKFTELSGFYDIMVLSCGYTRSIMALGWLLPIPEEKIPNLKIVDDSARHPPPDPDGRYLIPYLNDYVGLAFRNDILATTNLTWGEYFNPPSSWQGHVGLYDSPPVMFALAIISSGKDYPNATSADFSEAQAKIANLRNRFSPTISDDPTVLSDKLLSGELWATPLYAPDAQALLSKSTNISFLIPEDGSEYYYDYFIVNKDSQNQDLAFEFINFVLDPQILGRISAYLGAGATSEEARLVSRELATPMVPAAMTPDGKPLPRLQITYALNPEIEARWLSIMSEPVFPASGEELAD
ncbi:MAG: extracellular solute-binding protein [Verrucomicrobiota bacterium]|nr:extracellular solute-binding protein [Verrucomicrobiota bacterium]